MEPSKVTAAGMLGGYDPGTFYDEMFAAQRRAAAALRAVLR